MLIILKLKSVLRKLLRKNLFYHTLFNKVNTPTDSQEVLSFIYQIFVDVPVEVELQHSIVKEDDYFIEYRTVGTLLKDKLDYDKMINQYNQFYRPIIEYGFSDYDYQYRIRRQVDKKTGLITNASAMMKEEVKNNYQLITQFDLRKVDNY